jgi:hypothetical protein
MVSFFDGLRPSQRKFVHSEQYRILGVANGKERRHFDMAGGDVWW